MRKSCIPNIFTFINLSCGILSLLATFSENYLGASLLIITAALVDRYDGRIARYLNVSSDLGKELDSLADLVSFGVAPSVLIFLCYKLNQTGFIGVIGIIILLTFPICGAYRLARYNTTEFDGAFRGVPITITGSFLALFVAFTVNMNIHYLIPSALTLLGAYLMISTVELKKR